MHRNCYPLHFSKETVHGTCWSMLGRCLTFFTRFSISWRYTFHMMDISFQIPSNADLTPKCAAPVPRLRVQSIEASLRISANRSSYEARFQPDIDKTNFSVQGGSICLTALLHGALTGNSVHFLYGSTLPPYILCTGQL